MMISISEHFSNTLYYTKLKEFENVTAARI